MKALDQNDPSNADSSNRRWGIYEFGIDSNRRSSLLAYGRSRFPSIPECDLEELYDNVVDHASRPVGEPGAFSREDFIPGAVYNHLRSCLVGACLNYRRNNRSFAIGDDNVQRLVGASEESDAELRVRFDEILSDAEQHLDPATRDYVMRNVVGFERGEMRMTRKQIEIRRAKWSKWAVDARRRVGAAIPVPAFVRRLVEGGAAPIANAGGAALSTKVAAACVGLAMCGGAVLELSTVFGNDTGSVSHVSRATATSVVRRTGPIPTQELTQTKQTGNREERNARTRHKARSDDRPAAEREFGVENATTTNAAAPEPVASPSGNCSNSAAGEFSVDC